MSIFCLVNGSTQNPLCWKLLVPELEKHGHQIFTPSLPVDEPSASGTRYAEVIAQALEDPSEDVVLVGHSASGMFIPLVPSLRPVRQLVYLAALIPKPGASIRDQLTTDPDMPNPEWVATCRDGNDPSTSDEVSNFEACFGRARRPWSPKISWPTWWPEAWTRRSCGCSLSEKRFLRQKRRLPHKSAHNRLFEAKPQATALPQKSDYSATFGANCVSAPKINLTDGTGVQRAIVFPKDLW